MPKERIKLLLVEDDKVDCMAFERFVAGEKLPYDCVVAYSLSEARQFLANETFDIIITDYSLGDGTGFDVLKMSGSIPQIFVTGSGNEALALQALNEGALDYLVKDVGRSYLKCLPAAISSAMRQKKMELQLQSFQNTVGSLVSERDALLSTLEELRKSEHKQRVKERLQLGSALQSLENVLGFVSHELRTPLAGIRAMVEFLLMQEERKGEAPHEFLRSIQQESVRMNTIVNDLLEVARLNSGVARWNWSRFPVADVCRDAVASIAPLLDNAKVKISYEVSPQDLEMSGDKNAVGRLLVNLLTNAQKYTAEGEITLSCSLDEANGNRLNFRIADTGSGISKEALPKLGQAFSLNRGLVGEDLTRSTGLGLAICKGIVAAHGGQMTIESEEGCGTVVSVALKATLTGPEEISELPSSAENETGESLGQVAGVKVDGEPGLWQRADGKIACTAELLEQMLDQLPVLVFVKTPDLAVRYWNRRCEEIFGILREDILGRTGAESFTEEEAEEFFARDREAISGKSTVKYEEVIETPAGLRTFRTHKAPLLDSNGEVAAILATAVDISEQKQFEDELCEARERYELCIHGSGAGLWDFNIETGKVVFGPKFSELLGYRSDQQFPSSLADFLNATHPDDLDRVRRALDTHLRERAPFKLDYRLRTRSGEYRWFRVCGQALWNSDGKPYRMAGSITDVNEERQLWQLQREASTLRDALEEHQRILSVLDQELRTPLAGIKTLSELLLSQARSGECANISFLESLHTQSTQMGATIRDILEVLQLAGGGVSWNWARNSASKIVQGVLEQMEAETVPGAAEIALTDLSNGLMFNGDAAAIQRLLRHLLDNACEHGRGGKIELSVSVDPDDPARIVFEVADAGRGIPDAVMKRLGQPFKLNSGLSGDSYVTGSGFGLAVCAGIAGAHGGTVEIESAEGEGTLVRVRIRTDLREPAAFAGYTALKSGTRK